MFTIKMQNKSFQFSKKVKILDLIDKDDYSIIAAKVNNNVRQLDFELFYDAEIELLSFTNNEAVKIYYNSLRYLFAMATHNIYPSIKLKFAFSIDSGFMAKMIDTDQRFNKEMMDNIEKEMRRLISLKLPITRTKMPKAEAKEFFIKNGYLDKIEILPYRPEKTVHIYNCDNYQNYMYGYLVVNTSYLSRFKLNLYEKGILVRYPRAEHNGEIPPFKKEDTYQEALNKAYKWAKLIKSESIAEINSHIKNDYDKVNFVHVCEARHNANLVEVADKIIEKRKDIKLIEIAGPSSSGKTTFSNRLRIQLMTKGITPVKISIDDYYKPRNLIKPGPDGTIDLESIDIIDIKLFNEHLVKLINNEEVTLPVFDFKSGTRKVGRKMKLIEGQPIIIEGIHALNDDLTPAIKRENKFKIYIAPHVQVNIDNQSPVRSTDLRLLRRIVRDNAYRGYNAAMTIEAWSNVRNGEFKWIYHNEEDCDYVYNSDLVYEVNVMKKHALPLLQKITEESPYYTIALQLIRFLKYYEDISDDLVPCNSLLREFIGGSCFKDL